MYRRLQHIALVFLLASSVVSAQNCPKVTEAIEALKNKQLAQAKQRIEEAASEDGCQSKQTTWYYKAFILKDDFRLNNVLDSREKAIEAAKKGIALDAKSQYAEECRKIVGFLANSYYNEAAKDLNDQKYSSSHDHYVRYLETVKYGPTGKADTSAVFFAGYTAYMSKGYEKAIDYLLKAADLKYKDPNLYYYLAKSYWATGEKEKSYKTLETGHKLFPDNKDLVLTMVNYYMEEGKLKNLEATLDKAVALDPRNLDLKTTLAIVCEKLYETQGNNAKYFDKAERLYKEVIQIDPNNWKANYNLGIMHYNKAVNIIDKLDPDTDIKTINVIQEKCEAIFKQSLPYMLKAHELDASRVEVNEGLAGIYFGLNDFEKSNYYKKLAEEETKRKLNRR